MHNPPHLPVNSHLRPNLQIQPQSLRLLLKRLIPLLLRLRLLNRLPLILALQLIRPPNRNILGLIIAKAPLEPLLNNITCAKVEHHDARNHPLELARKRHELELLVERGDELGRAAECD
jgi:hypothetical protein